MNDLVPLLTIDVWADAQTSSKELARPTMQEDMYKIINWGKVE